MKYAALVAGAALFLTANAFSAEILTKEAFNKVHTQYTAKSAPFPLPARLRRAMPVKS